MSSEPSKVTGGDVEFDALFEKDRAATNGALRDHDPAPTGVAGRVEVVWMAAVLRVVPSAIAP